MRRPIGLRSSQASRTGSGTATSAQRLACSSEPRLPVVWPDSIVFTGRFPRRSPYRVCCSSLSLCRRGRSVPRASERGGGFTLILASRWRLIGGGIRFPALVPFSRRRQHKALQSVPRTPFLSPPTSPQLRFPHCVINGSASSASLAFFLFQMSPVAPFRRPPPFSLCDCVCCCDQA